MSSQNTSIEQNETSRRSDTDTDKRDTNRSNRFEKLGETEKTNQSGKYGAPEKTEAQEFDSEKLRSEKFGKSDKSDNFGKSEKFDNNSTFHPKSPIPLWLDCDPGNDDAFAILLAACHPAFNLVGISTVHGNVQLEKTTHNTLSLLDILHFKQDEIPVYPGEARPLKVEPKSATDVHGESGLGGVHVPEHSVIQASRDQSYLEALAQAIDKYNGELCIVCIGALTNFANYIQKYPASLSKVKYVSIMGGAFGTGNITPCAEFNIAVDPHAAEIVLKAPELAGKIVLAPLNLTHTILATKRVCDGIYSEAGSRNSSLRHMFSTLLNFYSAVYIERYEFFEGTPIHDPVALYLILAMVARDDPAYADFASACDFHFLQRHLEVQTEGPRMGETTFVTPNTDPMHREKDGVYVGQSLHEPLFWQYIFTALKYADQQIAERSTTSNLTINN